MGPRAPSSWIRTRAPSRFIRRWESRTPLRIFPRKRSTPPKRRDAISSTYWQGPPRPGRQGNWVTPSARCSTQPTDPAQTHGRRRFAGAGNLSILFDSDHRRLFAYPEAAPDFRTFLQRIGTDPVNARWQEYMKGLMEFQVDPKANFPIRREETFHLD